MSAGVVDPVGRVLDRERRDTPGADVERTEEMIIEDCGHVPQFEHAELTAALTRDFIARLPVQLTDAACGS